MLKYLVAFLLAFATPAQAFVQWFHTPSKDIQCSAAFETEGITLTCYLLNVSPEAEQWDIPKNETCTQTWGRVFQIKARGEVTLSCEPEPTFLEQGDELGINRDLGISSPILLHGIKCTAGKDAISCTNQDDRGFVISPDFQALPPK